LCLLFINFKQRNDSINRTFLCEILKEFGIPKKLVNLIKMTFAGLKGESENLRTVDKHFA
jgi:hypothetical protein